ncbi:glycosyltransferase [Vibrio parahaemolyticus]|uniref:GalNAc-alpha-(1->4)-GalNAc-alpha-(1->3)-diNAcBac-PP-undecaprenol alpha-1,4-N-acetyl-D-galactosaminyltransferase n=4 Tax=Vibrio parahaemolyticus TaxID=670 RepID=A0A7M1WGD6_VIBPH|nr:glycosyltransferase [Vibrio parahaemolyticus]EJG1083036.1 glycosyltransferase [Vibrio parahaemolyticus]ELA8134598.1 glycosyltransferase [Vibrio parahaemolyticus]MBM4971159.1 glycosyltransferase [Vibrio parahaemolyticus]MCD1415100.1 glycosyltransferase [Vibrio parahaemolyticus]QOS26035.1 GalNAc-alpha-(1->4)-GalNAc-alpha-(1->3)-diNAcBac-PP-undecaprenol alpha-1,4-N-acetyl-D-galactosaminyltransferase [Vibrio parahaemolyticus]
MRSIDILLLNAYDFGGIERASSHLLSAFIKSGYNTRVISVRDKENRTSFDYEIPVLTMSGGDNDYVRIFNYVKNIPEDKILISTYDRISIILSFFLLLLNKKNILIVHQHADYYAHSITVRTLRKLFYRRANAVLALTKEDKNLYSRWHKNSIVVPNILSVEPVSSEAYVPLKERNVDIIAIGRLDPVKRYDHFLRLAERLRNEKLLNVAKVIGDGPLYGELSKIDSNNVLCGRFDDVRSILSDSKILVVTSLRESFSMVILEALSQGCIVISYDCPTGPRELLKHGFSGFLVNSGNIDELYLCTKTVLTNIDKYEDMSLNSIKTCDNYLDKVILRKWKEVICELS